MYSETGRATFFAGSIFRCVVCVTHRVSQGHFCQKNIKCLVLDVAQNPFLVSHRYLHLPDSYLEETNLNLDLRVGLDRFIDCVTEEQTLNGVLMSVQHADNEKRTSMAAAPG